MISDMLDRDSFNRDGFIVLSEILDGKLIDACLSFFLDRYNSHFGDRETDGHLEKPLPFGVMT